MRLDIHAALTLLLGFLPADEAVFAEFVAEAAGLFEVGALGFVGALGGVCAFDAAFGCALGVTGCIGTVPGLGAGRLGCGLGAAPFGLG